jgi:hypothetical protein
MAAAALGAACSSAPRPAPAPSVPTNGAARAAARAPATDVPGDPISRMLRAGADVAPVREQMGYMFDVIGPRLAGSPEMQRANDWTAQQFRSMGADSAWLERFDFGVAWQRGPIAVTMLEPQHRELLAASWAWAPGTSGTVTGDVVYVDARTQSDFDRRFKGKLRGAWVMLSPAALIPNPDGPPLTAADSARLDSIRASQRAQTEEERAFGTAARQALALEQGAAGIIRDGAKEFALFTMSGSPSAISPVPQVVIANDNYAQFERLLRAGHRVRIAVSIHNTFTREPVPQYNTVAEIRGTTHPEQVVLLGAHLDSWDLATGGTDNGAGSVAVMDAARILLRAGARPQRTIRFVLFGAEEEGLFGSQAYAAAHKAELANYQAVLVLDNGTGRITGMALQDHDELRGLWQSMFAPLAPLGPLAVRSGKKTGTDHLSFEVYGVPAFNYDQLTRGYNHTHHSQVDDLDHSVPGDIAQAATVMAVNAWQLANQPTLLSRGPGCRNWRSC